MRLSHDDQYQLRKEEEGAAIEDRRKVEQARRLSPGMAEAIDLCRLAGHDDATIIRQMRNVLDAVEATR